ncbi:hypothetical protein LMED105_00787 [Limnobacter sp. MED105]|nr:hypothetical protein LMED105_00787 [Limnobacter sp. MED105]
MLRFCVESSQGCHNQPDYWLNQRSYWPNQRESQSFARKPVDPLLKFTLTHLARQKSGPSLGAGHWPTVADEFKRAGFLEGEAIGTSLLIEREHHR